MVESGTHHIPVLLQEAVEGLHAIGGGVFLDCTFGGGGHSQAILEANSENIVVGADRDKRALLRAESVASKYVGRFESIHSSFSDLSTKLDGRKFNGILADLGISTDQLKEDRGFSFGDDSALDMRMDESSELSAAQIVNSYDPQELFVILKEGGVGAEARAIAQAIVAARPLETTKELARVIARVPQRGRAKGKQSNPATVVFQAIRIAVNDEFAQIKALLKAIPLLITPGGRLAIISFHSLEDKAVTRVLRKWEGEQAPALWPGARSEKSFGTLLTKKAILPAEQECKENPSARSARLRVFEFNTSIG